MAYATPADYVADPDSPLTAVPAAPADLAALQGLLDSASARLDELTVTAVYLHDQAGMPLPGPVADAFRAACIRQAIHQDSGADGSDGQSYGAITLGPLQLPATTGQENRYSYDALQILRAAGLLSATVGRPFLTW